MEIGEGAGRLEPTGNSEGERRKTRACRQLGEEIDTRKDRKPGKTLNLDWKRGEKTKVVYCHNLGLYLK